MSPQQQMPEPKQKRKPKQKVEFDPAKVFDVQPAEDMELDVETSRYRAKKGEGGDRREK